MVIVNKTKPLFVGFVEHKYIFWLFKEMLKILDTDPLNSNNSNRDERHVFRVTYLYSQLIPIMMAKNERQRFLAFLLF